MAEDEREYHDGAQHIHQFRTRIDQPYAVIRTLTDDVQRPAGQSVTIIVEWLDPLDNVGRVLYAPANIDKDDVDAVRAYHRAVVQQVRDRQLRPR